MRGHARFERLIVELAADVSPQLARAIRVVWARDLPDAYALALRFAKRDQWIVIDERLWQHFPEERADTAAHEVAHLLSEDCGHGPEWRKAFRRLRRVALEMDWS